MAVVLAYDLRRVTAAASALAVAAWLAWRRRNAPATLAAWHALRPEAPLQPEEEIVDPHHHLWDPLNEPRPTGDLSRVRNALGGLGFKFLIFSRLLGRPLVGLWRMHWGPSRSTDSMLATYLAPQLRADWGGHNVIAAVYVQCGWLEGAAGEVAHQLASRKAHALPTAIVAQLELQDGPEAAAETLAACAAAAEEGAGGAPKFLVGFRQCLATPADSQVDAYNGGDLRPIDTPESVAAAKLLGAHGLVVDVCTVHLRLDEVARLAAAAPGTTFVLDHLGLPVGVGKYSPYGRVLPEWRESMRRLAACPNVRVKLSGLGMAVFGFGFPFAARPPTSDECADAWAPLVHFAIETFGVGRCFFASNFPPDAASCSYVVMVNAFKKVASRYSPAERRKLLRDNAAATYGLRL